MIPGDVQTAALTCIICGKTLEPAFTSVNDQWLEAPGGGTWFTSHGQYGSTVYDDIHGDYLLICICDQCMLAKIGLITERKPQHRAALEPDTSMWQPSLRWDPGQGQVVWDDPDQQVST